MSEAGLRGDEALARLVAWGRGRARPPRRALDLGGGGHTALAFAALASLVVAVDLEAVLPAARQAVGGGTGNVRFVAGDAGALPFDNEDFDVVTCRLAAHRFPQVALAVREIQRVLVPGGSFLLAERLALDDGEATSMAAGEPPPVRAYRRREWHAFLRAAGLTVMEEDAIGPGAGTPGRIILLRAEKD